MTLPQEASDLLDQTLTELHILHAITEEPSHKKHLKDLAGKICDLLDLPGRRIEHAEDKAEPTEGQKVQAEIDRGESPGCFGRYYEPGNKWAGGPDEEATCNKCRYKYHCHLKKNGSR